MLRYTRVDDDFQSRETSGAFFQTYKGSLMDPNYKEADKLMILLYFNEIFRFFQSLEVERI